MGGNIILRIFVPIIKVFKNLNETQKFSFIGIVLGIPIIVLTLVFLVNFNNHLQVLEKRFQGARYNYFIKELLRDSEQYRYEAMLVHRDYSNISPSLEMLAKSVEDQFDRIKDYDKQLTQSLHSPNYIEHLEEQWTAITRANSLENLSQTYNEYQTYLLEQLQLIAIDYHLNLSNDKYTYNLIHIIVKIMPQIIEQLSQIQMICQNSYPFINVEENKLILYSTSTIKNLIDELKLSRKVMLSADTNYKKYIGYQDPSIINELIDFVNYIESEFDLSTTSLEKMIDWSEHTIDMSFQFYEREIDHLEAYLGEQLQKNKTFRRWIVSFQFIAFILTIYSFIGFYLSIRQSLSQKESEKERVKNKYEKAQQKLLQFEKKQAQRILQAHEEERGKIARDLHDGIGQSLYSILVKLEFLLTKVEPPVTKHLENTVEIVQLLMNDIRRISHTLRPVVLDEFGFIPTLKSYIKHFQENHSIKVNFTYNEKNVRLNPEIETQLYRICQEALTNVIKHAQATEVHVKLHLSDESVTLSIHDNGSGFNVTEHFKKLYLDNQGIGLYSMKERTELLNGTFNITSSKNNGTKITLHVPNCKE